MRVHGKGADLYAGSSSIPTAKAMAQAGHASVLLDTMVESTSDTDGIAVTVSTRTQAPPPPPPPARTQLFALLEHGVLEF